MTTELLDRAEVCRWFGGTKALNASTLYRGIRKGRFPRPLVWGGCHPEAEYRPFYGAVAVAAERGDWDGVSRLCRALVEVQRRTEQ
jgi:hypothetical protein